MSVLLTKSFPSRCGSSSTIPCLTCVCRHRRRPCCPWSRRGCKSRSRCSCHWALWGRRRPRVSGSSCNDNVHYSVMSFSFTRGGMMRNAALGLAGCGKLATLILSEPEQNHRKYIYNNHSPPRQRGPIVILIPGRFPRWHFAVIYSHLLFT